MSSDTKQIQVISPWEALIKGNLAGKRSNIFLDTADVRLVPGQTNLVNIQSIDQNAHQLCLTLSPPRVVFPLPPGFNPSFQAASASGERDNLSLLTDPTFNFARPFVNVQWGIGGVDNEVNADISNGLCLNLQAAFLRVSCFIDNTAVVPGSTAVYVLSAFVGPGYPACNNAQRTIPAAVVMTFLGENSPFFPVPKFAKQVTVVGRQLTALGVLGNPFAARIRLATNPTIAGVFAERFFDETNFGRFDVPNGSYYFNVNNQTVDIPGAETVWFAVFDLAV